jgi:hypothetical protein
MAQFKQFLKQIEILEAKAIGVAGGAKTKPIGSSAIKPPRPITSKKPNPRGVPTNRTHAKSIGTGAPNPAPVVNVTAVNPKASGGKPPKAGKPTKKRGIVSKAMGILNKKGSGSANPKGFIHPPLSKVSSKK